MVEKSSGNALRQSLRKKWRGKRVTIMGLGQFENGSGWSSVHFFSALGAKLTVTDTKEARHFIAAKKRFTAYRPKYIFGKHRKEDFHNADLVIYNPVVQQKSPYLMAARERSIPTETDISFFVQHCPSSLSVGITGTRGKTTTSALIAALLKAKYPRTFLGGNIGVSPLNFLYQIRENDPVVLELSSWMLESTARQHWSPHIAVYTNIYRDHLDHYSSMPAYISAKQNLSAYQGKNDVLIVNADDTQLKKIANKAQVNTKFYSSRKRSQGYYFHAGSLYSGRKKIAEQSDLRIFGKHNLMNALAAIAVADTLRVPSDKMRAALKGFSGVPNRQECIAVKNGVTYINDTTATTPEATEAALGLFPTPTVLIAGGSDKGLSYSRLARKISRQVSDVVFLPGPASERLRKELQKQSFTRVHGPVSTMLKAVKKSKQLLENRGGTVLLSPAAASFSSFTNAYARGEAFRQAVRSL